MRVISGSLKGRVIKGFSLDGTRPTMDRVKESMFAMIQEVVGDAIILDLFSGSGNLAIEALSMGAKYAYLVDDNRKAIEVMKDNIKNFSLQDSSHIMKNDYKKALKYYYDNKITFDLIFLDPPYNTDFVKISLDLIKKYQLLNNSGLVVCEVDVKERLGDIKNFSILKEKKYGDKMVFVLE